MLKDRAIKPENIPEDQLYWTPEKLHLNPPKNQLSTTQQVGAWRVGLHIGIHIKKKAKCYLGQDMGTKSYIRIV